MSAYSTYSNGQYSSLVATSAETVTINSNSYGYSPATTTGYYSGYPEYCNYQNGNMYCYYSTRYYYHYSSPYYYTSSCSNGQAIIYYNGAYYAESCYHP